MNDYKDKSKSSKESPAELIDRFLQRTAIGVFMLALSYVMSAAEYLVSDEVAGHIDRLQLLLSALIIVVVLPAFLKYLKLKTNKDKECPDTSGYVMEMFKRAGIKAFSLTFIFLIAVNWVAEKYLTRLPAPFFINATLAFTLGVFSISFYFLLRGDDDEDPDDDFDAEPGQ